MAHEGRWTFVRGPPASRIPRPSLLHCLAPPRSDRGSFCPTDARARGEALCCTRQWAVKGQFQVCGNPTVWVAGSQGYGSEGGVELESTCR